MKSKTGPQASTRDPAGDIARLAGQTPIAGLLNSLALHIRLTLSYLSQAPESIEAVFEYVQ